MPIGFVFAVSISAQTSSIEKISRVFRDETRKNRKIPVDIFFPSANQGNNFSETVKKLPVICFGHGYMISGKWYAHICEILVPEGYILIFPGSEAGLFPSHKTLAEDMAFAVNEISKMGRDILSPLYGRIDTIKCLMGHSMGGGAMFLAANLTADVDAVVALSPYNTKPSAIEAASKVTVPTLIFSGTSDCITPTGKYHLPIYNSSGSEDKTFILIKGGTHCQMGVSHPKCRSFEKFAGCKEDSISMEEQLTIISKYIKNWLRFFLKGDFEAGKLFDSTITKGNYVSFLQSRPVSATLK